MSQQDFDNFKLQLKDWMDSHPDEYDCFEEMMNQKDNTGYIQIVSLAFALVPQYHKVIKKNFNQGETTNISDLENMFAENKLVETLKTEVQTPSKESIVPAMLSWLYFGKSFERMVERGEEIRKSPEASFVEKIGIAKTIQLIVSSSVKLGMRTKNDWNEHKKLMEMVDSDKVVDWAIKEIPHERGKPGRKSVEYTLTELLSTSTRKPKNILKRIEDYLKTKNTKRDIAYLKIALEELRYIPQCDVKAFRDALEKRYGTTIRLIAERGIQAAYKELNDIIGGRKVKELKENRDAINEVKTFLSE